MSADPSTGGTTEANTQAIGETADEEWISYPGSFVLVSDESKAHNHGHWLSGGARMQTSARRLCNLRVEYTEICQSREYF
jgi:hypothetical protein